MTYNAENNCKLRKILKCLDNNFKDHSNNTCTYGLDPDNYFSIIEKDSPIWKQLMEIMTDNEQKNIL